MGFGFTNSILPFIFSLRVAINTTGCDPATEKLEKRLGRLYPCICESGTIRFADQDVKTPESQSSERIFVGSVVAEICHGHIWAQFGENRSDGVSFVFAGGPDLYAAFEGSKTKIVPVWDH